MRMYVDLGTLREFSLGGMNREIGEVARYRDAGEGSESH